MSQPDDFGFNEEAALLKDSARKFFTDNCSTEQLHALVASEPNPERGPQATWNRELWQQLVALGWTAVAVPESCDGVDMPLVAVAGLVEEVGRAAFPCPLLATLSATYVLRHCGEAGHSALAEIAGGTAATLAYSNRHGDPALSAGEVTVVDGCLQGSAWFVQDAAKVERLLVCARDGDRWGWYWLASDAPGVVIHADAIVDHTRDQAHIEFNGAQAERLGSDALAIAAQAMPALWTLLSADMVGAAEWQLQATVDYVGARQQFDHPLGFFQAVKHALVNAMIGIDQAKSLVYNAACAYDVEPEQAARCAHMAKASASEAADFTAGRSVQLHGGIGFTWECFVHLYFKRQMHSQALWGDAAWHRARLADIVIGKVGGEISS